MSTKNASARRHRVAGAPAVATPKPPARGLPEWGIVLIIVAAAFLLYGNSIGNGYTVDDPMFTYQNRFVQQGWAGIPDIFSRGSMAGFDGTVVGPYRPVMLLSHAIEVSLWGNDPHGEHAVNIALYALIGVLLYRVLRHMLATHPPALALLVTLLYLTHPVHTEVVASIKSRDAMLAFLFGISALMQLLAYGRTRKRTAWVLSIVFFFLALLSKESAVTYILVAPLMLYFFTRERVPKIVVAVAPWLVALVAYLGVRIAIQGMIMSGEPPASFNNALAAAHSAPERLATAFSVLGRYLVLLVFPRDLSWDYSYKQIPIVEWSHPSAWASAAVYVGLFITALALLPRRSVVSFGILFYLLKLSVVSNVFFLMASTMGERFLFSASFGFCLVVGVLLWRLRGAERGRYAPANGALFYSLAGAILVLFAARTVTRNRDWKDNLSLFTAGVKVSGQSARAHGALATELAVRGAAQPAGPTRDRDLRSALTEYQAMVAINAEDAEGWYGLGTVNMALGDTAAAVNMFRQTVARRPGHARALNNIGVVCFRAERVDSAAWYFTRAAEADSLSAEAFANLGAVDLVRGNPYGALDHLNRALALEPYRQNAIENRRKAYLLLGDTARANASVDPANLYFESRAGVGAVGSGR